MLGCAKLTLWYWVACRLGQLRAKDLVALAGVALLQRATADNGGAQIVSAIAIEALQVSKAQHMWSLDLQAAGLPFSELEWVVHSIHAAASYEVVSLSLRILDCGHSASR